MPARVCKKCGQADRDKNNRCRICMSARRDAWRKKNPQRFKEICASYWERLKFEVLDAYGGRFCCACGYSNVLALSVDHIFGGGNAHRKKIGGGSNFYTWLKKHNYPAGYRILCMNCQFIAKRGKLFGTPKGTSAYDVVEEQSCQ